MSALLRIRLWNIHRAGKFIAQFQTSTSNIESIDAFCTYYPHISIVRGISTLILLVSKPKFMLLLIETSIFTYFVRNSLFDISTMFKDWNQFYKVSLTIFIFYNKLHLEWFIPHKNIWLYVKNLYMYKKHINNKKCIKKMAPLNIDK